MAGEMIPIVRSRQWWLNDVLFSLLLLLLPVETMVVFTFAIIELLLLPTVWLPVSLTAARVLLV